MTDLISAYGGQVNSGKSDDREWGARMAENGPSSKHDGRIIPSGSTAVGVVVSLAGSLLVIGSFAIANATYTHTSLYPGARVLGLVLGLLALPCLLLAWRLLSTRARTYVMIVAIIDVLQLLVTLTYTLRTASS